MLVDEYRQHTLAGEIAKAFGTLTAEERQVLRMRFGLGNRVRGMDEVVQSCGLTRYRARQIERHALRKLRASAVDAPAVTSRGLRLLLNGEALATLSRGTDSPERTGSPTGRTDEPEPPRPPPTDQPPEHEPFDRNLWDEV